MIFGYRTTCLFLVSTLYASVPAFRVVVPIQENHVLRPISQGLFNSLEELSRVVDVSYCVGSTGLQKPFECLSHCSDLGGFELLATWNTGPFFSDSCGYIALSHSPSLERIIVAFRGTYSITNTIIDLSVYPQSYVPYQTDDGRGGDEIPRCLNCTVHAGFMTSWQNTRSIVLDRVSAAREQNPNYQLVLVGHSLGGAVATLAGVEMQLRGWEPTVTTFGEPKVGNRGFADFLGKIFGISDLAENLPAEERRLRKITHIHDPVPLLPLEEWGYAMHGGEIFISKEELPLSVHDVHLCEGATDSRCISGSEGAQLLETVLHGTTSLVMNARPQGARAHSPKQQILSNDHPSKLSLVSEKESVNVDADAEPQGLHNLPWDLVPSRYRLWELFFSHRDYFWRLGLCVPGGDPTGMGG
ncbi:lipase [Aspergillus ellipticus CBS 707.79]|uniref:feruloyl esterase n=1 Tax=Aspergillus ellipticus CBS 707.79 TaxID=1448320 RepID=A0A319DAR6_9EURO|nr:lipase [Aspergillus ellipticus CBS 707.79]